MKTMDERNLEFIIANLEDAMSYLRPLRFNEVSAQRYGEVLDARLKIAGALGVLDSLRKQRAV
jgi:hypothetical protein